jgi:peptide deformylase
MTLTITTDPNPILHKKARELSVEEIKAGKFNKLIADMTDTMYAKDGVGIAAPQVSESVRIFVIAKKYVPFKTNKDLVMINPVWEKKSIRKAWDNEGCLSVPNTYGEVKRYLKIKVKGLNEKGEQISFDAEDFQARIIQHETDHLNGVLFIEKAKKIQKIDTQQSPI